MQILHGPDKDWQLTTNNSNECLPAIALANVGTVKYCTVCLECLRDGCPKLMANTTLRHTMQTHIPKTNAVPTSPRTFFWLKIHIHVMCKLSALL